MVRTCSWEDVGSLAMRLDGDQIGNSGPDEHQRGGHPLQAISRDGVDRPQHGAQLVRRVLVGNARALMKVFTHADKAVDVLVGYPSVVVGPGGGLESHFAVRLPRRERA